MNHTQDTFQKFSKRSKAYDDSSTERKDKKQSYKAVRNLKRMELES